MARRFIIFIARRVQPSLSLVNDATVEVFFVLTSFFSFLYRFHSQICNFFTTTVPVVVLIEAINCRCRELKNRHQYSASIFVQMVFDVCPAGDMDSIVRSLHLNLRAAKELLVAERGERRLFRMGIDEIAVNEAAVWDQRTNMVTLRTVELIGSNICRTKAFSLRKTCRIRFAGTSLR